MYLKSAVGSLVASLLAFFFLVSLCNGACMEREARLSSLGEKPDGCMDGDIKRELNSTWFNDHCIKCTCDLDAEMSCCDRVVKPFVNRTDCKAVLNQTSCTYTIRKRDNPTELCESGAMM
ncbi:small serum protein 2-like [Eleutherodactylus coqui]|uniref:small serum protein 2-like n=1 Tax=Eleutherodactylus coqui TaxID=57060 RepID=UPI0034632F29